MLGMRLDETMRPKHLAALTPQDTRERLFALIEDLIRRLARQRPTILAMEDLHWADDSSIELSRHLLPLVRQVPLAIVGVFRRGEGDVPLLPRVDRAVRRPPDAPGAAAAGARVDCNAWSRSCWPAPSRCRVGPGPDRG